jgi:hypothetical protein
MLQYSLSASRHRNCSSCVGGKNECAWCSGPVSSGPSGSAGGRCFPFVEYVPRYAYGGCTAWLDGLGNRSCTDCARHSTCAACLADYQCGWCGNTHNPTIGACVHGDFVGECGRTAIFQGSHLVKKSNLPSH